MAKVVRTLIVGGGISGLTSAIALARKGIVTEVIEITADGNTFGAGIQLAPPALRALNAIGLAHKCLARGFPHARRTYCDLTGTVVGTQELPRLDPNYPAQLGIPRPVLHGLLLESCREFGVNVRFGLTVNDLEASDSDVQVVLNDGRTPTYDVVIGADGIYSDLRTRLFGSLAQPAFTGLAAWRIRASRPPAVDGIVLYRGGRYWAGFNPVTDCEGYIFMVEPVANRIHISKDQLIPRVKQLLADYNGIIAQLMPCITDPANVLCRPIEVVNLPAPWYRGSTILIGDAAHALAPSLGAGALIAIEDAVVLAEELATADSVPSAFQSFMTRRYERCRMVVDASIQLAAWQKNPLGIQLDPERLHAKVGVELSKPI